MKDNENVTIIIATHNNVKTILRAVESVSDGIRGANNIVVGDNDSTDGTYELLCDIIGAKPIQIEGKTGLPPQYEGLINGTPITIFKKRFSTIAHTINTAIHMKWKDVTIFGFMEPTSWYAGDKISQAIRIFQSNNAVACVVSDCDNHFDDGRVERVFRHSFDSQKLLYSFSYDRNFLVKSQIFAKLNNGFNEGMEVSDEYDFLIRLSEIGFIYHIPAPLHNNIITRTDDNELREKNNMIARKMAMQRRGLSLE